MNSKINRQKQIISLLNSKYSNLLENDFLNDIDSYQDDDSIKILSNDQLLKRVYNFYKSIIQNINNGLITIDLEGEITFVNKAAAQMLCFELDGLLGKNIKSIFIKYTEVQK